MPAKTYISPVPQTVVIGKKSIWATNKINLQWITKPVFNPWNTKKNWSKVLKQGLQVLFHIVMAKFPIPENCSAYVPMILRECLQITSTKFRGSTFPGNMHNYIWCPYYLPSFMKFCSVVSEELCWQAASEVYFGKC